jgi:hypothetical protein
MKNGHISDLIENNGVAGLNATDKALVESHVAECAACADAFRKLEVANVLIRTRLMESIEPSPFFSTRLMAAVRAKRVEADGQTLWGLWRMARGLVTGMAATVVLLGGLTFFSGANQLGVESASITSPGASSPEQVLFQDGYQAVNYDPTTVLGPEDADGEY